MSFNPSFFTDVLNGYLPEPEASLLNGIVFGVDLKTSRDFYNELKTVGLLHLVVLSGANITLLGTIVGHFTSFFSKRISILITVLTVILFILFVGPKAPIVRAGIMGILTYVAILSGRKNVFLYSLLLSLFFIAVFFPKWLTGISLQLSYASTIGIVVFGQTRSKNWLVKELAISISAQILTAPIIFFNFRELSLISPVSNIMVSPIIGPVMIFGMMAAVLGKISYWIGFLPSIICYGLLKYMTLTISFLSKIPFAFYQFR